MRSFVLNVQSPVGVWGVTGTDHGVDEIRLPHQRASASRGAVPTPVAVAARQLEEYFAGRRREFDVELVPSPATEFQREVWTALCAIPYGEVRTYGDVADAVHRPRAMRAVGNANHANPWPVVVPCHRVVAARGLGGYGGGGAVKRYLLALEGVVYP
jgi:methylated-DNA-[protein]-cysteine S-methyltransferase